jgi:PAS domain S-box-containing protein
MEPLKATHRKVPQRTELLSLLTALVVVSLIAGLSLQARIDINRGREQVATTRRIVEGTNTLLSLLKDAETGQRGFLLTGNDRYLNPYRQAIAEIPSTLKVLADATANTRPSQGRRIEDLRASIGGKLDELEQTIDLRRTKGLDAAVAVVLTDRGNDLMEQIRRECSEIQMIANNGLARNTDNTRARVNQLGLIGTIGSAGLLMLLIFSTIAIQRGTARRQQLIRELLESEAITGEARDWLQTTIGSIGDGVIATDARGNVTLLNGVSESLTGWTRKDAVGLPLEQIFVISIEETGELVENPVSRALREGRIVGLANHTRLTARDGRHIPIDDSAAPIRDSTGNIIGVVLVFRDVTERREVEIRDKESAAALARQAALLARTNADLQQFAYSASHDLQEPLRMIANYSQLLLKGYRGRLDDQAGLCVNYITEGTHRMQELLADLLSYTQLSPEGQASAEIVDLSAVCEKATQNLKAAIEESNAVVACDPLPQVPGHEAHFIQLFQNLVANAIKYRSDVPPRIHISAEILDGDWRFAVRDNGIGIPPEHHRQIFGVFKRLHGKTIPGTGIGLAICQRVVDTNGGRIWVESEPNRGATFYFTLPRGLA